MGQGYCKTGKSVWNIFSFSDPCLNLKPQFILCIYIYKLCVISCVLQKLLTGLTIVEKGSSAAKKFSKKISHNAKEMKT